MIKIFMFINNSLKFLWITVLIFSIIFNPFFFDTVSATNLSQNLVGLWRFNEFSDIVASDSSGSGNNGTVVDATWTTGKLDNALSFDGSGDYVSMGDLFYSDTFTVCAWIKLNSLAGATAKTIVLKGNSSGVTAGTLEWVFQVEDDKVALVSNNSSGAAALIVGYATVLSAGQWYHACGVQGGNGNTGYLYLNGVEDDNASQTSAMRNSASLIQVGVRRNNNDARYFDGLIDDVRIYNVALTASDVKSLYAAGPASSASSIKTRIKALLRFKGGLRFK